MNGFHRAGSAAAAAVFLACLVPVSAAFAGYQNGGYAGTTDQMETIGFRVGNGKVKRLATTVYAECADSSRQLITVEKGRTKLDDRRFSLELDGDSALKVTVSGKLRSGGRATGRIEASVRPPDTTCVADLRWTAEPVKGKG